MAINEQKFTLSDAIIIREKVKRQRTTKRMTERNERIEREGERKMQKAKAKHANDQTQMCSMLMYSSVCLCLCEFKVFFYRNEK